MKEFIINDAGNCIRYIDIPQQINNENLPIMFIHGLGCAGSFDYPAVAAEPILKDHRCILIDLMGFGYSDKPEGFNYEINSHVTYLKEFSDYLGLKEFILFAHSMGGPIAINLAERLGGRVRHLILSEANLDMGGGFTSKAIYNYSYGNYINYGFNDIIQKCKNSDNSMWAFSFSVCSPKASYELSKNLVEGQSPSWRSILYKLECEKTYIFGEKSLPDPDFDILRNKGLHMEIVSGAGHSMAVENPAGLASAIKNGIKKSQDL